MLPGTYEIDIALPVQTAAIIGLGLVNKGSSNRTMTELTLA